MAKFRIYAGDLEAHRVDASTERGAIRKWLNEMGYDSINQAASECFCKPDEIRAVKLTFVR